MTALAELGIHVPDRPGSYRRPCPECASTKHRPHDDALWVTVRTDGSTWFQCHRCGLEPERRPELRREHRPRPAPPPEPDRSAAQRAATALWRNSRPITPDHPAGRYLLGRCCSLPHPAGDLRCVDQLRHKDGWTGPALVALVTAPLTGEAMTLHQTWIMPDGSGKAPIERPRLFWPGLAKAGGVVRLWPDEEVTQGLLVGEGVETVLSGALAFTPAWACLDKSNLASLPVLPGVCGLTVLSDHDEDGGGERAAEACARRWADAGVEARVWRAPTQGVDFNDQIRSVA